jgi:hypothetical protein
MARSPDRKRFEASATRAVRVKEHSKHRDDLKAVTKKQLEELRHSVRKDPKHVVHRLISRKLSKRDQRFADKYCDKRAEYDALDKSIELLTKQRSFLAAELGEMDALATPAQRSATRAEGRRRGLFNVPVEVERSDENAG